MEHPPVNTQDARVQQGYVEIGELYGQLGDHTSWRLRELGFVGSLALVLLLGCAFFVSVTCCDGADDGSSEGGDSGRDSAAESADDLQRRRRQSMDEAMRLMYEAEETEEERVVTKARRRSMDEAMSNLLLDAEEEDAADDVDDDDDAETDVQRARRRSMDDAMSDLLHESGHSGAGFGKAAAACGGAKPTAAPPRTLPSYASPAERRYLHGLKRLPTPVRLPPAAATPDAYGQRACAALPSLGGISLSSAPAPPPVTSARSPGLEAFRSLHSHWSEVSEHPAQRTPPLELSALRAAGAADDACESGRSSAVSSQRGPGVDTFRNLRARWSGWMKLPQGERPARLSGADAQTAEGHASARSGAGDAAPMADSGGLDA